MANRLKDEQSPYLLQHAHNPVDWYPWGEEAFERAKTENKPVIVSIGYAACHWCHVMERESFENEETAQYMNRHFVNIKVDREEHPDVDHMYMDAVQAIAQSGGWPLNVFATPAKVPFYGGTYYPPEPMYSRASWMQVLERINEVWQTQQEEVQAQSGQMLNYLRQISQVALNTGAQWSAEDFNTVTTGLLAAADKVHGGFGNAPKFPGTMAISFLLDNYHYTGNKAALEQALLSLDKMAAGGIYDQLSGGFCRYSTDVHWLAPHFEKMLYDNALLIRLYSDAGLLTGKEGYHQLVKQSVDFIYRELYSPHGGFYSALDADSEGVEGKYYTWTWNEWQADTDGDVIAADYYGVREEGNWEHTNILHKTTDIKSLSDRYDKPENVIQQHIATVNEKLVDVKDKRVRPATDDKCLLGWNALMNLALCRVAAASGSDEDITRAVEHMQWMMQSYHDGTAWFHTWKNGTAKIAAKLDDYAYLVSAMLQLASVSGTDEWIIHAGKIVEIIQQNFLHENKTFFYYSSVIQQDIPVRKTDLYDGALPSANAVMAANLIWLGMLLERSDWIEQGKFMITNMKGQATRYATSFAGWSGIAQQVFHGFKTVICTGKDGKNAAKELNKHYISGVYVLAPEHNKAGIPLFSGKTGEEENKIYICDTDACMQPVGSLSEVLAILKNI